MGKLTHVAIFCLKPQTTEAQTAALSEGLAALPGLIPEIRRFGFGRDAGLAAGTSDFAVVAEFDDVAGYRAYASSPHHVKVFEQLLQPILESRQVVQFTEA